MNYEEEIMKQRKIIQDEQTRILWKVAKYCVLGIVLAILFFGSWYTIPAGERGILLTFQKPSTVPTSEGLHFKLPLIQSVVKMDVKTQKYEADLTAASKDLQDVKTKIAINYHLVPENVPELYKTIGIGYADKVIYPLEQETNKAATAQFTAEELITKRDQVREIMKTNLKEKLIERGIIVEEISIVDFQFSSVFTAAIENKVVQEQNSIAQKNKLEQIKYEAEQKVVQATAEAESLRLQKQQITPELLQLRQIEVQSKMIEKWNGIYPTTLFVSGSGGSSTLLPTFQINK